MSFQIGYYYIADYLNADFKIEKQHVCCARILLLQWFWMLKWSEL